MEIRKAVRADLPEILEIYNQARIYMCESGNPSQWGNSFPPVDLVETDIAVEKCFVCIQEKKHIAGVFYFAVEEELSYGKIWEGKWLNEEPYGVIHRLAGASWSYGIAQACIAWCSLQCNNLRIDTHEDNLPMQHILKANGFLRCGMIELEDRSRRIAFQRA